MQLPSHSNLQSKNILHKVGKRGGFDIASIEIHIVRAAVLLQFLIIMHQLFNFYLLFFFYKIFFTVAKITLILITRITGPRCTLYTYIAFNNNNITIKARTVTRWNSYRARAGWLAMVQQNGASSPEVHVMGARGEILRDEENLCILTVYIYRIYTHTHTHSEVFCRGSEPVRYASMWSAQLKTFTTPHARGAHINRKVVKVARRLIVPLKKKKPFKHSHI